MATGMGNVAYDYRKTAYVPGSAAPAARPVPQTQPGRTVRPKVVRKTKKQLRVEARRARWRAIQVMAVAAVLFGVLVFQIYSQVRVDELDREISAVNSEISVVESENTRLNMKLDANISLEKVDDYARNVLGMVKVDNYQVNYVNLSAGDAVEVSGGKVHTSLLEKIKLLF